MNNVTAPATLSTDYLKAYTQTVYEQLGGRKFAAMTGLKALMYGQENGNPSVMVKVSGGIAVGVTLDSNDTYTLEFWKRNKQTATVSGVYHDMLVTLFEKHTGLRTSL